MLRSDYDSEYLNSSATTNLILGLLWVLQFDYAKYGSSPLTISKYAVKQENLWYQNDVIEKVLRIYAADDIKFQLEHSDMKKRSGTSPGDNAEQYLFDDTFYRKDKAIWFVDSMEAFELLVQDLVDNNVFYNRNGYFCMVYTGLEAKPNKALESMFRRLFDLYVLNINVFLAGKYTKVYTYYPFQPNLCNGYKPKLLMTFGKYNISDKFEIFPSKLANLYGCPLFVSTWNQNPFALVDYNKTTGNIRHLYGIEGDIMSLMAEHMNFSMKIPRNQPSDRGDVLENGTVTGTIKMVFEGHTNLTVNSWQVDKFRAQYMLPAFSHLSVRVVVAIPEGLPMYSWERLIKPFGPRIWMILAGTIALALLFIFVLKFLDNIKINRFVFGTGNRAPVTNLLITLYGSAIPTFLPRRNFARFLLASWVINTFILRSAYLSELYYILQDARARNSFSSLGEIIQRNYTIYAFPVVTNLMRQHYPNGNFGNIDGKENRTVPELLKSGRPSYARHVVVALEPTIRYFGLKEMRLGRQMNILPNSVITAPLTFYMRKHSYLKHHLNNLIIAISSSGLVHKFEEYYLHRSMLRSNDQSPEPISLTLCQAIFKIYLMLCLCCIFIFFLERISQKLPRLKRFLDFVNC